MVTDNGELITRAVECGSISFNMDPDTDPGGKMKCIQRIRVYLLTVLGQILFMIRTRGGVQNYMDSTDPDPGRYFSDF